jgi:protein phosphatase
MTNTRPVRPPSPTSAAPPLQMQCANPACLHLNVLGKRVCDRCQSPLQYRYLRAVGKSHLEAGDWVGDRYVVMGAHLWLDTQPSAAPEVPVFPDEVQPYLQLYSHRLHVPGLHGFGILPNQDPVFLLDNIPVDAAGKLYPAIAAEWSAASAVRQVYWLWQMLQLWEPLKHQGVVSSLLIPDNLRVEGWRVRLCELVPDGIQPQLKHLADCWQPWVSNAQPSIVEALQEFLQNMREAEATQADLAAFGAAVPIAPAGSIPMTLTAHLNQILLEQAAQQPLRLDIFGATTTGPQRDHNEDACFPVSPAQDKLLPQIGIICDGIGGHEGGEVASQLALSSLKIQLSALVHEYADKPEPASPAVIEQQLASLVRVANNLISSSNNSQEREMRQRMGTTLVMAIQLPQKIAGRNAHELYLVNVGDSRAYWITPRYCHALTIDDDVLTREVSLGRNLYAEAKRRPDAGALTQALGTREGELLNPRVQRFIVEEDGLLLLCSDGLSDSDRVEQSWEINSRQALRGEISLEQAVLSWIDIANQKNGHDNTSVVLMRCRVTDTPDPEPIETDEQPVEEAEPEDFTAASRALLYGDEESQMQPVPEPIAPPKKSFSLWTLLALGAIVVICGGLGLIFWQRLIPSELHQDTLPQPDNLQPLPPPQLPPAPASSSPAPLPSPPVDRN